jgi:hypothetical protein
MENSSARRSFDATDSEPDWNRIGDPQASHCDDPLGDEAAFPMTWQQVALGDAGRD